MARGLQIVNGHNYTTLIIETNSASAFQFMLNGCPANHSCAPIIEDICVQTKRIGHLTWSHSFRKTNSEANLFAKKRQSLLFRFHIFDDAPPNISLALSFDCLRSFRVRGF
ncbi:hypothetical protein AHAS_Ahas06G0223500 [Arachis hypogaea]